MQSRFLDIAFRVRQAQPLELAGFSRLEWPMSSKDRSADTLFSGGGANYMFEKRYTIQSR